MLEEWEPLYAAGSLPARFVVPAVSVLFAWGLAFGRLSFVGTVLLAVLALAIVHSSYPGDSQDNQIGGVSPAEALRLGQEMYRSGILPNGKPMSGTLQGDIPIDGTMFSCTNCHLRSGVGSAEGGIITLPTNGEWLYKPLEGTEVPAEIKARLPDRFQQQFRPAYTDESLALALRDGVDPGGRNLGKAMPRYDLNAMDMEILKLKE